ncbi:MAG TPA: cation-translocating P-type ATPase [Clostridia bacterium]|nr:cation-translocating P-type ATPase [Clostridia bacterium]
MRKINKTMHEMIQEEESTLLSKSMKKRFSADILQAMGAFACLLAAELFKRFYPGQDIVTGFIYLVGVLIIGIPVLTGGIRGLMQKEFSSAMEILVSIAMILSVLNQEYSVAILIPLFLAIVHFFEEKSIMGGQNAIEGLKKMQSTVATQLIGNVETQVDAKTLKKGDRIVVRAGMSLPIDGTVVKGAASINQQSLTGEAMPCPVEKGDSVYAGTFNLDGELTVLVEKPYADSSFQKIVHMLEESEKGATAESRMVDRFMAYYIPLSLIVATLVWLFTMRIDRAVAILVVSCPCGHMLVSSAPMIAALSIATKRGVLIKNTAFIEKLAQVDTVYLDKTGTITYGNLVVERCVPYGGTAEAEVYGAALAVAAHSLHPLSKAICAKQEAYAFEEDYEITEQSGLGVTGVKDESVVLLGNENFLRTHGVAVPDALRQNTTCSYVVRDALLGVLCFSDTLRADVPEMVEELYGIGVREICLLTGDREAIARGYKDQCNLTRVHAQLLPEQKQEIIEQKAKESYVAFVGDGINDALALSSADVGIAMGAMGSDTAIQSADITLMNEHLDNIPFLFRLSKTARDIIHQNIVLAFSSSLLMILLASTGVLGALSGALLHNAGAFFVLLNSARLMKPATYEKAPDGHTVSLSDAVGE